MPKNRKTYAQKRATDKRKTIHVSQNTQANPSSSTFSFSFIPHTKETAETHKQDSHEYVKADLLKTGALTGLLLICESILWIAMNLKK